MPKAKNNFPTGLHISKQFPLSLYKGMVDHGRPRRDTGNYRENNWARIMDGHELVDRVTAKVMDMVGGLVLA